jgi:hypothetical protein
MLCLLTVTALDSPVFKKIADVEGVGGTTF